MKDISKEFVSIDPSQSSVQENYKLLVSGVSPRPIALVSTISKQGVNNLSPFSFFSAFGANPPVIGFSPTLRGRDGTTKDTLQNLKEVAECVVQCVPYALVQQASLSSTEYPSGTDEFVKAGLTPLDSHCISPKRVLESPFQMECKVQQIVPLGGKNASGNLVICEVVHFHVSPSIMNGDQVDPDLIDLVGRNSANFYTRASGSALFEVEKPLSKLGIGIDQLPQHIRCSTVLSANNLGQLGSAEQLPTDKELEVFLKLFHDAKTNQRRFEEDYRQLFSDGYAQSSSESSNLIEKSAKMALDATNPRFALNALCSIPAVLEMQKRDQ